MDTERLAVQVFGRCPIALCATCAIDGCGKMSLRANIFPYGIIYTERLAVQVFGRCPIALCATCAIDGCGKKSMGDFAVCVAATSWEREHVACAKEKHNGCMRLHNHL